MPTALADPRDPERIRHPLRDLIAQRLYGLCCGYEDLNDHDRLRFDPLMQTAVGKVDELASSPTFSRLETRATRADILALNRVLVEQFIAAQGQAPRELILDVDASDVPLHGEQERSQFHGYYDHYCYLPLYIYGSSHRAARLRSASVQAPQSHRTILLSIETFPTHRDPVRQARQPFFIVHRTGRQLHLVGLIVNRT